jgi:hypothetical protein
MCRLNAMDGREETMKTEIKPQHTPMPWEAHEDWDKTVELFGGDPPDKFKNITHILSWEDAAFIVRAVNAHEALIEAMRSAIRALEAVNDYPVQNCSGHTSTMDCVADDLKQAIAKAEGK